MGSNKGKVREYQCAMCGLWHKAGNGSAIIQATNVPTFLAVIECFGCGNYRPSLTFRYVKPQE